MTIAVRPVRLAMLGCGTVGSEVARLLDEHAVDLAARVGAPLELVGVAVRNPERSRPAVPGHLLTADGAGLVVRPDVDVVIEVVGGLEPTRTLLLSALRAGKSVVTANKALLATDGPSLYEAARLADVDLYYEASVGGAIPLLRPLRESLAGDRIRRVLGIVNGTTNYILTRMDESGASFADALAEAQDLGYAEADPTADVQGYDAASKAAILASLSFHTRVTVADVYCEGISGISAQDVASARDLGYVIKLLAIAERLGDGPGGTAARTSPGGDTAGTSPGGDMARTSPGGDMARTSPGGDMARTSPGGDRDRKERLGVRVHPTLVPRDHPLAGVRGAFNAVFVEAEAAGQLMFYGPGAGGAPTASAVLGDVVSAARHRVERGRGPGESAYAELPVVPVDQSMTRCLIRLDVADRPGVLAAVAQTFAEHEVSIATVRQDQHGTAAVLEIMTHSAPQGRLSATVEALRGLDSVSDIPSVLRVLSGQVPGDQRRAGGSSQRGSGD